MIIKIIKIIMRRMLIGTVMLSKNTGAVRSPVQILKVERATVLTEVIITVMVMVIIMIIILIIIMIILMIMVILISMMILTR